MEGGGKKGKKDKGQGSILMRNRILFWYIVKEIWPIFFASLLVSVFIVITTKIFTLIEMVVSHGARLSHIVKILIYLVPEVLLFSFPAATLISVLVAFLRFSSDNEIIALKASGVSLYQILPPVITISFIAGVFSFIIATSVVPLGNRSLRKIVFQIVKAKADVGIKERVFCEPFKGIIFYVKHFSVQQGIMHGVFVVDKRNKMEVSTIVAQQGEIINWKKKDMITLHFVKGTIFSTDKDFNSIRTTNFRTYDLNLELKDITQGLSLKMKPKEMGIRRLWREIKKRQLPDIKHNLAVIELIERFSIPIGVFLMGIIAAPLGMQIKVKTRSMGIGIGLMVFFVYYTFLAAAKSICETGAIPPALGMWIPDIFLLLASVYFVRLSAEDREIHLPLSVHKIFRDLKRS